MLTLHAADLLLPLAAPPVEAGAVAVDGGRIVAVGPYEKVVAEHPGGRVRRWPGLLTPGLAHGHAFALLEGAYHPDPREAGELGTEPVTGGDALAGLGMTDERWGASARRGVQRMLRYGVTALRTGPFTRPAVRTAVARSGLVILPGGGPASVRSLDPLPPSAYERVPESLFAGVLAPGSRADFAVFDALGAGADGEPLAALARAGAGTCVATVLDGRLLHRRR